MRQRIGFDPLDRTADGDSIPSCKFVTTSIRRRSSRTSIATVSPSRKSKTCFVDRWRIDQDEKGRESRWVERGPDGTCA
jgi:hypothetical protein